MNTSCLIHGYMKGFRLSSSYSDTIHSCENQALPRSVCAFTCRIRDSIICRARNSYVEFVTYPYIQKGNLFSYCYLGHTILKKSGNCSHRVYWDKVPGLCVKKTEKGGRRRRIKSSFFLHKVPGIVVKTKIAWKDKKATQSRYRLFVHFEGIRIRTHTWEHGNTRANTQFKKHTNSYARK